MENTKKRPGLTILLGAVLCLLAACAVWLGVKASMPDYPDAIGADPNVTEKITGEYLIREAAKDDDTLLIFGSSELKTTDICTHPANFFAGKRCGFQVDLIGRGSCQSLVHALAIAGAGDALNGKKVVLITAPQSYVEEGIAPDLFMANFSELQVLELLKDDGLSDGVKQYLCTRVCELAAQYNEENGTALQTTTAAGLLAKATAKESRVSAALLTPYAALSDALLTGKDLVQSKAVMADYADVPAPETAADIDWTSEKQTALAQAETMVTGNEYYMQDSYYDTYVGLKLAKFEGKDSGLSYAQSPEYDDLRCLLDVCAEKEMDVLLVHVPMNGKWSDYTGFSAESRQEYYENVQKTAENYDNVELLDLTGSEYEPYFLCDTMHLGWLGWLEVDRAICEFYEEN